LTLHDGGLKEDVFIDEAKVVMQLRHSAREHTLGGLTGSLREGMYPLSGLIDYITSRRAEHPAVNESIKKSNFST